MMVWDGEDFICAPVFWQHIFTMGRSHSVALSAERSRQQAVEVEISVLVHKLALRFYSGIKVFTWVCFLCLCDIKEYICNDVVSLHHLYCFSL